MAGRTFPTAVKIDAASTAAKNSHKPVRPNPPTARLRRPTEAGGQGVAGAGAPQRPRPGRPGPPIPLFRPGSQTMPRSQSLPQYQSFSHGYGTAGVAVLS